MRSGWTRQQPIHAGDGVRRSPRFPVLTLGFARRFASYKRPTLLLQDMERLKDILTDTWMPVQIIFAGKAHQDDQQSKQLLQQVFNAARDQAFGGRIAFVEDYDELLAQYLVHGVDVWVNNPLPPMEASGTSGMKATLNGVPQLSVLDGWWIEGYNGKNGWAVEGARRPGQRCQGCRCHLRPPGEGDRAPLL